MEFKIKNITHFYKFKLYIIFIPFNNNQKQISTDLCSTLIIIIKKCINIYAAKMRLMEYKQN